MSGDSRPFRVFLASFLVLFLEVALIRWMPAYVRLLSYFSNFILLASSSGSASAACWRRRASRLFPWFPLLQAAVIAVVYFFRLEVAVPSSGDIYFSSGTPQKQVLVESTMLLPVLFVIVAALFATVAQRMAPRDVDAAAAARLHHQHRSAAWPASSPSRVMSWLELSPVWWFGVAFAAVVAVMANLDPEPTRRRRAARRGLLRRPADLSRSAWCTAVGARRDLVAVLQDHGPAPRRPETVVEVNNIFHQSMAPVEQKEYFYQWPYMVFGDTFKNVLILGAGSGTDVAAALRHGVEHVDAVEIDPVIIRLGQTLAPGSSVLRSARHRHQRRRAAFPADHDQEVRPRRLRADRLADAAVELLGRAARELHVHRGVVQGRPRRTWQTDGLLVIYNYFRERWLVDRLANTAAAAFGEEPYVHVHEARAYLGVLMAGPRLHTLTAPLVVPDQVLAFGQSHAASPAKPLDARPVGRAGDRRLAVPLHARSRTCPATTPR